MKRIMVQSRQEQCRKLTALLSDLTGLSTDEIAPLALGPVALGWMSLDLDASMRRVLEIALYNTHPWKTFIREHRKVLTLNLADERGPACDQCGHSGTAMHEAFVTRAQVRGWRQFYIFVPENCVFLCGICHGLPNRERLLEVQRARGYDLDYQGRWPGIREVLKTS